MEDLLLNAYQGREYREQLQQAYMCDLYHELDASQFDVQLQSLKGQFSQSDECSIKDCIASLQELSLPARTYFSEVVKVVQLILVMPATNAVSECLFYHEAHRELPEEHHVSRPPQSSDDLAHLSR